MSWIIGIKGHAGDAVRGKIASLLPAEYRQAKTIGLEVFGGGLSETTCFEKAADDSSGFFVCGIGIETENDQTKFMDWNDWQKIM